MRLSFTKHDILNSVERAYPDLFFNLLERPDSNIGDRFSDT